MNRRSSPREGSKIGGIDWKGFEKWLFEKYMTRTAKGRLSYAGKYADCLINYDFSRVNRLSPDKRIHVMKALSALSKFLGIYEDFKRLVKNYGLKWGGRNSDDLIIERLTKATNPYEVYDWIKQVKGEIPELRDFMDFIAVTGLRFVEAVNAYNLIVDLAGQGRLGEYYNHEKEVLEHFRFKDMFIRTSKKAFISFVPAELIQQISGGKALSQGLIQNRIKRRIGKLRFGDIREVHASILTKHLKQPEIDFLHGRTSTSVFMRNYFNPAWIKDLKSRALEGANELLKVLS